MEQHFTPQEVAEALAVNEGTLSNWRGLKVGPRFVRIGGTIRYPASAIEEYLKVNAVQTRVAG